MAALLFLALVATPIVEIVIFIQAGEAFGLWPTIGGVILTAIIGTFLLRQQGFSVLRSVQASMDAGRPPVEEVFHGFCIVIGGALLLTPGFLTDAIGFALLTPPFRRLLGRVLAAYAAHRVEVKISAGPTSGGAAGTRPPRRDGKPGDIIDGEYEEIDDEDEDSGRQSPDQDRDTDVESPWKRRTR